MPYIVINVSVVSGSVKNASKRNTAFVENVIVNAGTGLEVLAQSSRL